MIGFFQNSMAKHHRLIFGVLLVFIVVSFVFYTGSGSAADLLGIRRSATVMGVNVSNAEETAPYRAGVLLSNGGRQYTAQDLIQRIYMVKTAEAFQVPEPTQAQLSAYLSEQGFSSEVLETVKRNFDISEDVLRTMIIHNWKLQQFLQTFGNVPAVFEADVELAWKEMNTQWTVEIAEFPRSACNIACRIPADKAAFEKTLSDFYDAHKEDFRIAERVKLSYAKIVPAADIVAKIPEPTDFELSAFVAGKFDGDAEKAAEDLKTNRALRVAEWKKSQALDTAAAELSNSLYEKLPTDMINPRAPDFADALSKSGFGFTEIPAFPRDEIPSDTGVPAEILQSVASGGLNETLWRTDAIPVADAVYVVIFLGTEPSRIPELKEVLTEVTNAWVAEDKDSQFIELAVKKGDALRARVAEGKTLTQAATEDGLKVQTPPAFSMHGVPEQYRGADLIGVLKAIPAGEVSPMIPIGDTVFFARTVSKNVPEIDKNDEEFKRVWTLFNQQTSWETFQMQLFDGLAEISARLGLNSEEEQ